LFHADGLTDGQTDMTKLTVAFRNFGNAPKKGKTEELRRGKEKENKEETNDKQERKLNLEKVEIRKSGPVSLQCSETDFFE